MREGTFDLELPVELTEQELQQRAKHAALGVLAIEAQEEKVAAEAEAWKLRKKELELEGKKLVADVRQMGRVVRDGTERRQVKCRDELRGSVVYTIREDTNEVAFERAAERRELEELRERETAKSAPKGYTPEEKRTKLAEGIAKLCTKHREEAWVIKQLLKAIPEATEQEAKTAINDAVETGALVEKDGKLLAATTPAPAAEAPVVEHATPQ